MITKIKNYNQSISWQQLKDIRLLGLIFFLVIVLLMTWSGVKTIQTNYELEKQIAQLQQAIQVQQLKNDNQQLDNAYLQTNQYLELAARQNFGLAAAGEKEYVVPKSVALAHLTNQVNQKSEINKPPSQQPKWQSNLQAWINFFLHRPNTLD